MIVFWKTNCCYHVHEPHTGALLIDLLFEAEQS